MEDQLKHKQIENYLSINEPLIEKDIEKIEHHSKISKGMIYALITTIVLVKIAFLLKLLYIQQKKVQELYPAQLTTDISSFEIQFIKCTFETLIILSLVLIFKGRYSFTLKKDADEDTKTFRSVVVFGCLGNYLIIAGLENVYLAIASLLNNTFPLFVIIVAYFMHGETLTKNQSIAITLAFIGVILMSLNSLLNPTDNGKSASQQALGFLMIIFSDISGAVSFTISKNIKSANPFRLASFKVFLIYLVALVYILFMTLRDFSYPYALLLRLSDISSLLLLFGIAASDLAANMLIFKTFQLEKAGIGASMNFLCLVWSLILDTTVFGQSYSTPEIIGGLMVLTTTTSILFMTKG